MQVDPEQHAEPDQVNAELLGHWRQQRHDDEGDFKEVEEECQDKHHQVDGNQKPKLAAGQSGKQMLHPDIAVHAAKHQGKNR